MGAMSIRSEVPAGFTRERRRELEGAWLNRKMAVFAVVPALQKSARAYGPIRAIAAMR
jgi:hypothetical protein